MEDYLGWFIAMLICLVGLQLSSEIAVRWWWVMVDIWGLILIGCAIGFLKSIIERRKHM